MKKLLLISLNVFLFISFQNFSQDRIERKDIEVHFNGDAQIEVGNHYIGTEFHHSFPVPQRISFYYPVANSIDLSNDYWKRDSTFIMALGLMENNKIEWLHTKPFQLNLTPYSVTFTRSDSTKVIEVSYNFCKDKPAMVLSVEIKNLTNSYKTYSIYADLQTSLKTSHTYNHKSKAWTEYEKETHTLYTNFEDPETQHTQLFVSNTGEVPINFSGKSSIKDFNKKEWWIDNDIMKRVSSEVISSENLETPASRFIYQKSVYPEESIKINLLIGSAKKNEAKGLVKNLQINYANEIQNYENYILEEVNKNLHLTGDSVLDKSILWAKAILAVNQHYIDRSIQPMPCPAEYNFYFTHDVLLTDLAVVNFDLLRVKKDLQFIIDHASEDKIIPHAYYWKDSTFKTELVTTDGWNHFWFIILSADYLKHSSDTAFANELYPYIKKSLEQSLSGEKDGLMYAYRPDWWDIGRNYGPRSYMTILAIKSIRDFTFISERLGKKSNEIKNYSALADEMQIQLNKKLWSDEKKYLINYFEDGSEDPHYYMGSLLAVYFDLLEIERAKELLATTEKFLLDEQLGIYTVYPMDFHELIGFFRFAGNEAGDPHKYINGGIWPHSNAWYALALMKIGEKDKALKFIKQTMTIDGIINSPNGQPAMYEYRNSNFNNPQEYGKVDKPQFMWAAGWYLYILYEYLKIK